MVVHGGARGAEVCVCVGGGRRVEGALDWGCGNQHHGTQWRKGQCASVPVFHSLPALPYRRTAAAVWVYCEDKALCGVHHEEC